ncbi:5-formyltetrahydrofolate cyclo-ligase [Rhodohalobacter sp. SW132]|uniref:5-formyltetrahydrofolate cyclo-ligase n=1 Tax=Rhodohalobacter sp. SW132 TaxID=2293433 RepID=UPI000E27010E|nr:5-formyltetrahydrofolate cyclo-ligase [Rhodohalobacter sp. SW132]REL38214.1 5-formyltetrahydrofolate cyclo-ligase [Rhodohalobacter sp. SW132]
MTERSIAEKKENIRRSFLHVRRSLSEVEHLELSIRIADQLFNQHAFQKADTVHTYVSMEEQREVSTTKIIETCFNMGKRVVVPKMKPNGKLSHHRIKSLDDLYTNEWGVKEPFKEDPVDVSELSLIIVPMAAADFSRNRIGYGKGYYDRFLKNSNSFSVGLCYNCTLSWSSLPVETFDEQPNQVITENKVI